MLIVEDHPLVREALVEMLTRVLDRPVHSAGTVDEAWDAWTAHQPHLVLTDVSLGCDRFGGIDLTRRITTAAPEAIVVALSGWEDPETIGAAFAAGATGYIAKSTGPAEIARLVALADQGLPCYSTTIASTVRTILRQGPRLTNVEGLSAREVEVLRCLTRGVVAEKDIAAELHLSPHTVKSHLTAVFRKLNVADKTSAAVAAMRLGLAS